MSINTYTTGERASRTYEELGVHHVPRLVRVTDVLEAVAGILSRLYQEYFIATRMLQRRMSPDLKEATDLVAHLLQEL